MTHTAPIETYPFEYPCPHGNHIAFFIDHVPNDGEVLSSKYVCFRGAPPEAATEVICQECGKPVGFINREVIRKRRGDPHQYFCGDCEGKFISDTAECPQCGSKNVGIDEPIIRRPKKSQQ